MPDYSAADVQGTSQGEKVPLLRPWKDFSGQSVNRNSWIVFFGWLKYTLIPAAAFLVFSITFMLGYHKIPRLLVGIAAFFFLACLSDGVYIYYRRKRLTPESLGFTVCAFAIVAGSMIGTSIHLAKLTDYWPYYSKRHYTNVAPDEPAASHADASVLVFMQGARPDSSRSLGYARYSSIYCVAPIALEAGYADDQTVVSDIQYWAVGKDCCMGSEGFACDGASNDKARSGFVLSEKTDADTLLEGILSPDDMSYYEKAVLMTASKFDLTSPKERLYVRFVEDIGKARATYWNDAWWSWLKQQFLWLLIWATVGVVTVIVGAGDPEDNNKYNEHMVDIKQNVLMGLNHCI